MSDHDEFESLIRSFKLDDLGDEPQPQKPPASRPFDYEAEARRSEPPRRVSEPAAPTVRTTGAPVAPRTPAAPTRRQPTASAPREERRRNFRVDIDESDYGAPPPPTRRASGGGSGGSGGGRGGRGGRDNREDDGDSAASAAGRWLKAFLVLLVVLGVSGFLALFALQSASDMFGLNKPDSEVEVVLPDGQNISQVATLLKEHGIVTQPLVFRLYSSLKPANSADQYIPGTYTMNTNMSYEEIMRDFRTGNIKRVEVTVQFYEGMTLSEMAERLEEKNVCDAEAFYAYLEEGEFPWEYAFLEDVPDEPDLFRRWEGYLFPDTYIFYEHMKPAAVVQKFFSNFNNKMTDKLEARMEELGLSLSETITLASVIQKEAGFAKDMMGVSTVFQNRLAEGSQLPKLQSDVTRDYVNNYIKPYLTDAVDKEKFPDRADPNQSMYDAYNTYVCDGLPVGPVCNPGMLAINAALQLPLEDAGGVKYSDFASYYYFVTDEEGTYYYAATLDAHNANVATALQKGEAHGTTTEGTQP